MNLICFFEDLLETGRFLDCLFFAGGGGGGECFCSGKLYTVVGVHLPPHPPLYIQLIKVPQHEDFDSCCDFCLLFCCLTNFSWSRIRERVRPNEVECPSYDPRDVSSSSSSSARPLICSLTSSTLQAVLQA